VKEEARMTAEPLTPEEEAGVRQMLWEHELAYANVPKEEGVEGWAHIAARLLATLDAARTADPGGLREALEFIADWAHDCIDPDDPDTMYGFEAIEKTARAALTPETTAPGLPDQRDTRTRIVPRPVGDPPPPPPPPPKDGETADALDVERLTKAIAATFPGWLDEAPGTAEAQEEMQDYAVAIAAEYERLALIEQAKGAER
jgi:hypothetical protein